MEQRKNNIKIIAEKKNARVILPNMLTLIGVCIGLTSIRFALDGKYEFAIIAIIFSFIFSFITIALFLNFIKKFSLKIFVIYRIALSLILLSIAYF